MWGKRGREDAWGGSQSSKSMGVGPDPNRQRAAPQLPIMSQSAGGFLPEELGPHALVLADPDAGACLVSHAGHLLASFLPLQADQVADVMHQGGHDNQVVAAWDWCLGWGWGGG